MRSLSHTEYHGWTHPGECNTPNIIQCEYDSDTFHLSKDGGYHFESFTTPKNFVAGVPYKYEIDGGPTGFSVDTDIIHYRDWYYAVATAWTWPPGCSGQTGPGPNERTKPATLTSSGNVGHHHLTPEQLDD